MVKNNNLIKQLLIQHPNTKPKQLPKTLQGHRFGQMSSASRKSKNLEVDSQNLRRSEMSVKEKVEFVKKHGKDAYLELPT